MKLRFEASSSTWLYVAAYATIAGGIARFSAVSQQSLWIDEFLWTRLASGSTSEIVFAPDGYPPLFGLLVHWLQAAGLASDSWLRVPAALAGTLSIPALYWVAARLSSRRIAALTALLLAANPLALWYSIEVGAYAPMMLAALSSSACLIKVLESPERLGWRICFGALTWLGFGLHYYYLFVPIGQILALACQGGPLAVSRAQLLKIAVPTGVALGLWVPLVSSDLLAQAVDDVARPVSWADLPYTAFTFLGGLSLGPSVRALHEAIRTGSDVGPVVMDDIGIILLAGVIAGGLTLASLGARRDNAMIACLAIVAATVIGTWFTSLVAVGYRPRYVIAALPFALLAWTYGLNGLHRAASAALLTMLMLVQVLAANGLHDVQHAREDTRSAAWHIAQTEPALPVLLLGEGALPFARYAEKDTSVRFLQSHDLRDESSLVGVVEAELKKSARVWVIEARPWTVDRRGVGKCLPHRFRADDRIEFAGVTLTRYSRSETPVNVASR